MCHCLHNINPVVRFLYFEVAGTILREQQSQLLAVHRGQGCDSSVGCPQLKTFDTADWFELKKMLQSRLCPCPNPKSVLGAERSENVAAHIILEDNIVLCVKKRGGVQAVV